MLYWKLIDILQQLSEMSQNPLLGKLKWRVAGKLPGSPGASGWDKMRVAGKGLAPLSESPGKSDKEMPKLPSNPFLRSAYFREFAKRGVLNQSQANKAASAEKTAFLGGVGRAIGKAFSSAPALHKSLRAVGNLPLKNFFTETAKKSTKSVIAMLSGQMIFFIE